MLKKDTHELIKPHYLTDELKGTLLAVLSGLLWGTVGYFGFNIMVESSITNMLFWRFLIAFFAVAIVIPFYGFNVVKIDWRAAIITIFAGGTLYSSSTASYFLSSKYIGTGLAMVIFFTFPAMVLLFSWLFGKHHVSRLYLLAIAVTLMGLALLADPRDFQLDIYGIILGLLSALTYSGYIITTKKIIKRLPPLISTLMVTFGNCICFFIFSLHNNSLSLPVNSGQAINMICMGIICTSLPILLLIKSMKYISASKASLLTVLEPVMVFLIGILALNETVTALQLIGIALVLSGTTTIQFDKETKKNTIS